MKYMPDVGGLATPGIDNPPWQVARAQMLLRVGRQVEACLALEVAIRLGNNPAQREYLIRVQATANP